MAIDKRLLEILCCPVSRQPVRPMNTAQLQRFNAALAEGALQHADGSALPGPLKEGLLTRDGRTVYRVDDGIPVMLADQAIDVTVIGGLAAE